MTTYDMDTALTGRATGFLHVLFCIGFSLLSYGMLAHADTRECSSQLAKSAEADVARVSDWTSLYKAFRRYKQCDDGSIGESFSDRVTVLLSTRWDTLPGLGELIAKDRQFAAFVINHVDATADPVNLKRIVTNAKEHGCPSLSNATCGKLKSQAEAALRTLDATQTPKK